MSSNEELLLQFKEIYEKQETIAKQINDNIYTIYSNTELHCLATVYLIGDCNGSDISRKMKMTRSAITKVMKKLISKGLINTTNKEGNRKEIIYKLTKKGIDVAKEHDLAHDKWLERDIEFLNSKPSEAVERTLLFMKEFNNHLEKIIKENEK